MSESEHTILEADLARELGLSKEAIRDLRKQQLEAGEFEIGRRGTCLTAAAAVKLRRAAGAPEKKGGAELGLGSGEEGDGTNRTHGTDGTNGDLKKNGPEKKGGAVVPGDARELPWSERAEETLYVRRCTANVRIVEACRDRELTGEVLRVRVKSNVNFTPRMELKVKQEAGSLYALVGRCPRWRGRY